MKILKIDHLGIAKSIDAGKNFWTQALGLSFEGAETVAEQKVTTAFFPVGESEVELLESTAPDGRSPNILKKKGEVIQRALAATWRRPWPSSKQGNPMIDENPAWA
jgi:methylmalonyl-CoA/ethylmalonyl-CoA epimerase